MRAVALMATTSMSHRLGSLGAVYRRGRPRRRKSAYIADLLDAIALHAVGHTLTNSGAGLRNRGSPIDWPDRPSAGSAKQR